MSERRTPRALPLVMWGVLGIAVLLRAPVTSMAPALPRIQADLDLSAAEAGATTSLPLLCFGIFAFATPFLVARWGLERTTLAVLIPLTLGLVVRSAGSAPAFFAGVLLIGVGIAIGNVLVPAIIRARFPLVTTLYMGLYTGALQLSSAVGTALTAPLEVDLGLGWAPALAVWTVPAAAALAFWLFLCLRPDASRHALGAAPAGMSTVVRRPRTWAITVFMGVQSAVFYSLMTWLPAQLVSVGLTPAGAGLAVGAFSLVGLPTALLAPRVATSRHAALVVTTAVLLMIVGLGSLSLGPTAAVIGTLLTGFAQGGMFSIALTYIADQPDPADVPAISAMAQGVGYIVAGLGPIAVGALAEETGGWAMSNLVLSVVLVFLAVLGSGVGRSLHASHRVRRV